MIMFNPNRFSLALLTVALLNFTSDPSLAADEATVEPASDAEASPDGDAATAAKRKAMTYDLGSFRLREFRPTRNETAILLFAVHLKLHADVSEKTVERLDNWKQRLRNEALTAVRSVELADYQDPGLVRLQKVILLRINRLLPMPLVERIYVTEFTVGDH